MPDITHKDLLDAINANTLLVRGIGDTLVGVVDTMVTKDDLKESGDRLEAKVGARIDALGSKLSNSIDEVNTNLSVRIDEVDSKLSKRIDEVDAKLSKQIDQVDTRLSEKIDNVDTRLARKIDSAKKANTHHHLETRKLIGSLNSDYGELQEGFSFS